MLIAAVVISCHTLKATPGSHLFLVYMGHSEAGFAHSEV